MPIYGDSHVLHDVSFALGEARMLGLLGRNGAGKIDLHERRRWACCRRAAARCRCSATPVTGAAAGDDRRARRRAGAAGPPHLQKPDACAKT